jgi:hypothetical protein
MIEKLGPGATDGTTLP